MPFSPQHSLLRVEVPAFHCIDTRSTENLAGIWQVFSKSAHAVEDGRRLENLSWRLWNRETFCCSSRPRTRSSSPCAPAQSKASSTCTRSIAPSASDYSMPALSTSLDSASSHDDDDIDDDEEVTARVDMAPRIRKARPELRRKELSSDRRSRGREKHITPDALASIVTSIKNTKSLEPIDFAIPTPSPKPADKSSPSLSQELADLDLSPPAIAPLPPATPEETTATTTQSMTTSQTATLESSASTFDDKTSQSLSSDSSSNTEMSTHSVVRGFVPGGAPSSYRSQTNLVAQPTPILKTSPSKVESEKPKKKGPMFTIGTSSGEEESSFESHMHRSSLSESLKRGREGGLRKGMSYREEMARAAEQSPVFETDEEDEDVSESAIEDDDDSSDWEDSDDQSRPSSVNEKEMHFQRVDSRPEITSRRSVLTSLLHEPDRAKALANAASRSTPAIRRSRTATPNGPSLASSPDPVQQQSQQHQHQHHPPHHQHHHHHNPPAQGPTSSQTNLHAPTPAQPISRTQSGALPIQLALSPRTTRRNMLSTELTESLRKNLLWERQHRSTGNLAAMNRRRHTSTDVKNLRQMPEPGPVLNNADGVNAAGGVVRNFNNDYFNQGLQEYHAKGW